VLGGPGYQAPSDTLRIAGVGVGGMGRRYLQGCASERIEVLCDVDHGFAAPVFRKYPGARVYSDFRQMFDKEEKNIDAVIVATPDHMHAMVVLRALRMRKHVIARSRSPIPSPKRAWWWRLRERRASRPR